MEEGWIDYVVPQDYWDLDNTKLNDDNNLYQEIDDLDDEEENIYQSIDEFDDDNNLYQEIDELDNEEEIEEVYEEDETVEMDFDTSVLDEFDDYEQNTSKKKKGSYADIAFIKRCVMRIFSELYKKRNHAARI